MEEFWKDIHLSSLHENPTTTTTNFQDFLAQPSTNKRAQPPLMQNSSTSITLSLNSFADQRDDQDDDDDDDDGDGDDDDQDRINVTKPCLVTPSSFLNCFGSKNKRVYEDSRGGGDQRHKRMMKNRESAARSRARRQAYTSQLEREVTQLMEENKKLRAQPEKLLLSAPAEIPKKPSHFRSLTAPF